MTTATEERAALEARGTCSGCYLGAGRVEACYRWNWAQGCKCVRCEARRASEALEEDPGDMGEPPIATQRQEAARQGNLRLVRHGETGVVCDYDERRPKHSRCGVRLTREYHWYAPGQDGDEAPPATMCPSCSRRTALEGAGTKVQPCASCGALMYWGVGARGGKMPISVKTGESHFRDCPDAAKHSKRSKA